MAVFLRTKWETEIHVKKKAKLEKSLFHVTTLEKKSERESSEQNTPPPYCTREFPIALDASMRVVHCVHSPHGAYFPPCRCLSAKKEFPLPDQYCVSL